MIKGRFTHLDKLFWPNEGFTKGDLIRYYGRIAKVILPYLKDRPMVLNRHPDGIKGVSFFQKNVDPKHLPPFVKSIAIRAKSTGRNVHYVICNNKNTLLYLANLGCIEMHPWNSRTVRIRSPDFLTIDLDPSGNSFNEVITVAQAARKVIETAGGRCLVKTSGKRGLHILVPLQAIYDFSEVRSVAKTIVGIIHARLPKLTTLQPRAARRQKKIYLDYVRNSIGQTLAAPYSLRAYPGATISTPLDWSELNKGLRPSRFTMQTIFKRIQGKGDVWKRVFRKGVNLRKLSMRLKHLS